MSYDDDSLDNANWSADEWSDDEGFPCPECGAEVHAEAEACPSCGYWITDADREVGWREDSASGRVRRIGFWLLGLAAIGYLLLAWA